MGIDILIITPRSDIFFSDSPTSSTVAVQSSFINYCYKERRCKHLKGHVNFFTIALYLVEFSLITKSIWERNIVRFKITIQTMLLTRFFYFYWNKLHKFPTSSIFLQVAFFNGVN